VATPIGFTLPHHQPPLFQKSGIKIPIRKEGEDFLCNNVLRMGLTMNPMSLNKKVAV
jgi:hypothetical protein